MTSFLIVDDDQTFSETLADAISKRGFETSLAHNIDAAEATSREVQPEYVLLDLKMPGGSGLKLIPRLLEIDPFTKIVILTGYASIATAIEAVKLGAVHYLTKPVSVDEIIEAFEKQQGNPDIPLDDNTKSLNDLEGNHIKSVLDRNNGNISATARELGLHRRTLQRKLGKRI